MMRAVLLCLLFLVAPASASAATLVKSGSTLTYTAAAGRANQPNFDSPNAATTVEVTRTADDNDTIQATGCSTISGGYACTGIQRVVIDTGDGNDIVTAPGVSVPMQISGGAGNDQLRAGSGADAISGGDGDDSLDGGGGSDTLDGGAGDDDLAGGTGADTLIGGTGIDQGFYGAPAATPAVTVTLDGVANDGVPGEADNFGADIEDVSVLGVGAVVPVGTTLVGNAGPNTLTTGDGNDAITGGAGNDTIVAAGGDDTIDARDGYVDRVECGAGNDTVSADPFDLISASCETVNVADIGNAADDKPPTIAWTAPKSGAKLGATTTLTVTATDDRGLALVRFLDDERVVCEDTTAPYTCDYKPTGDDVGRDTLTAVAVDTSGQTASAQRAVVVNRFKTTVDLSVRPRGSTYTAGGSIDQPSSVVRKQACSGTVTVRVKSGSKTVTTKKAKLTSRCTFSVRNLRPKGSKLKFVAEFAGNDYIAARKSRTVRATKR